MTEHSVEGQTSRRLAMGRRTVGWGAVALATALLLCPPVDSVDWTEIRETGIQMNPFTETMGRGTGGMQLRPRWDLRDDWEERDPDSDLATYGSASYHIAWGVWLPALLLLGALAFWGLRRRPAAKAT